jgi:hypothetical protein
MTSCVWPAAKLSTPDVPTTIVALLRLESIVYERAAAPWTIALMAAPDTTHIITARRIVVVFVIKISPVFYYRRGGVARGLLQ